MLFHSVLTSSSSSWGFSGGGWERRAGFRPEEVMEGLEKVEERDEEEGWGWTPDMWRQLYQAGQQNMTQQKPPNYAGLNEDQRIDGVCVLMRSQTAAACRSAPSGCCWPQTVSTPKKITLSLYSSLCLPLIASIFTALIELSTAFVILLTAAVMAAEQQSEHLRFNLAEHLGFSFFFYSSLLLSRWAWCLQPSAIHRIPLTM